MTKLLRYCFFFTVFLAVLQTHAQTVVYNNTFTSPAGFPPPGFTIASFSSDATPGSNAGVLVGGSVGSIVLTPDILAPWVTVATSTIGITNDGYATATAPLASYTAPFNATLSANTQNVRWAFNMQTGAIPSGFSDGRDNVAAILVCDDPNVRNAGQGYGVTYNPMVPGSFQLFRYTGGLLGVITPIVSSGAILADAAHYGSVQVLYEPATNNWTLYARDDGPGGFSSPTTGTFVTAGSGIDGVATGVAMTDFGFYANFSVKYLGPGTGPDAVNGYFDNYSVSTICSDIIGGLETCIGGTIALTHLVPGGTWSSFNPATATVGATTGIVTGVSADTVSITYSSPTCNVSALVTVNPAVITPITGDTMLCRGETSLLATGSVGGTWSNLYPALGTVSSTGNYTSLLAGTDTVIYHIGPGCEFVRTVHIDSAEAITGTGEICAGSTTAMANAVSGGTWASSAPGVFTVSTSGVVTGIAPTTATLTYTNTYGCATTTVITVNTTPTTITGNLVTCVGSTTALNSTPSGGAWSNTASGEATVDPVTGVVSGVSIGTNRITYTLPVTSCFRTAVVTVNPAPAAITGTASVCFGASTTLSHATPGGTWSTSNAAVATVVSGNVTGTATGGGTATITYTLPVSGCFTTRTVTVLPLPGTITGSTSACVGSSTTLSTTTGGATWSSSTPAVATVGAGTGIVNGIAAGTSTIVCTSPNGCTRSVVVTVNVVPTTPSGTALFCEATTTTLTSTPSGGTWSSSTPAVATVAGGVVTGTGAGTANITYNRNGCVAIRTVTVNAQPSAFSGAATVCEGTTVTLGSTPLGGTWNSDNTAVAPIGSGTGVLTGLSAGTANITYTSPVNGCERIRTQTVNPVPAAIGGPLVICPGASATLTNTSTPGTWSSSNTAIATIVGGTGVYTGITGGTSTITYTQTSTGCFATTIVTVIASPTAILSALGDTVICPGDFVTLTVTASPGVAYRWYNGAALIPGATSPTYAASATGLYRAEVIVGAGCSTLSAPISVNVAATTATITVPGGTTATCSGTPVTLDANTGIGLTYQWELGGAAVAGATGSSLNALAAGTYAVRVTNAAGCWALSAPVTVTTIPLPSNVVTVSGALTICSGSTVTFTAASGSGYSYQWYDGSGPIAGATAMTYAAGAAGSYYVVVTNSAGCAATSAGNAVIVNPLPDVTITPIGNRIFCAGGNVILNAVPGFNYQWYRDGVAITGATNSAYAATTTGGYRVRVLNGTTGCWDMTHADTTVNVISSPTTVALTPARYCWGGSAMLGTSVSGLGSAISYQWFFNGVIIPGAIGSTYNAGVSGNYYCSISVPGSCTATTSTITVTEMPLPDPPANYNGTVLYTHPFYVSWQWYKDLAPIPGATHATLTPTGNGDYKVAVTDTNGCQSVSETYILTGWTPPATGITTPGTHAIRIYPTPAHDVLHIEADIPVRAVLSSAEGRRLMDVSDAESLNIGNLAGGLYLISLFDNNGQLITTQKVIKQ